MDEATLPTWELALARRMLNSSALDNQLAWQGVESLHLCDAVSGRPPAQATELRLAADHRHLLVRFDCEDREPWGTLRKRDSPLYEEEVVEVFLAPGTAPPRRYVELEVSPLATLFDAVVDNPHGDRRELAVDTSWNCPGLRWAAGLSASGWWATLAVPWLSLSQGEAPPEQWRANFYRIDRPRRGPAEYSAWSPTFAAPADFHRPRRFGHLRLPRR